MNFTKNRPMHHNKSFCIVLLVEEGKKNKRKGSQRTYLIWSFSKSYRRQMPEKRRFFPHIRFSMLVSADLTLEFKGNRSYLGPTKTGQIPSIHCFMSSRGIGGISWSRVPDIRLLSLTGVEKSAFPLAFVNKDAVFLAYKITRGILRNGNRQTLAFSQPRYAFFSGQGSIDSKCRENRSSEEGGVWAIDYLIFFFFGGVHRFKQ